MNIVKEGSAYRVFADGVETFYNLPVATYGVCFNNQHGYFYLECRSDLESNESKIYGDYSKKADKVVRSFDLTNRNFGVIISGHKGSGKSLLVRMISEKVSKNNIPVIIVDKAIPGVATFLGSIDQKVMIVFDEFEKTFAKDYDGHDPQVELLSLFDGVDGGKKLFVVTCNDIKNINEFFVNRPGRFHYHFEVEFPNSEQISKYLHDKLGDGFDDEIDRISKLGVMADLTYDSLRAISFDLKQGYSLDDTLRDLNIGYGDEVCFDIDVFFDDGTVMKGYSQPVRMCGHYNNEVRLVFNNFDYWASFSSNNIKREDNIIYVDGADVQISGNYRDRYYSKDEIRKAKEEDKNRFKVVKLVLTKVNDFESFKFTV